MLTCSSERRQCYTCTLSPMMHIQPFFTLWPLLWIVSVKYCKFRTNNLVRSGVQGLTIQKWNCYIYLLRKDDLDAIECHFVPLNPANVSESSAFVFIVFLFHSCCSCYCCCASCPCSYFGLQLLSDSGKHLKASGVLVFSQWKNIYGLRFTTNGFC